VPQAELALNGISLGATETQVTAILGLPPMVRQLPKPDGDQSTVEWVFANLNVGFRNGRVVTLSCYRQVCRTPAGIAVGDSVSAFKTAYGRTTTVYIDNQLGISVYRVSGSQTCAIRIEHDMGVVVGIDAACNWRF